MKRQIVRADQEIAGLLQKGIYEIEVYQMELKRKPIPFDNKWMSSIINKQEDEIVEYIAELWYMGNKRERKIVIDKMTRFNNKFATYHPTFFCEGLYVE